MEIKHWSLDRKGDGLEVSAVVDGYRLWFRVPAGFEVSRLGDPFVAAALLPAMLRGGPLTVEPGLPVSAKLLGSLPRLQDIFHCWDRELKVVPVSATPGSAVKTRAGGASFFSGGVDSVYTFLERLDDIDHVIFINGFDFISGPAGPAGLTADDIADLPQLIHKLLFSRDAVSKFLRGRMPKETLEAIGGYDPANSDLSRVEGLLTRGLNAVLAEGPLFSPRRFSGVVLRDATKALLTGSPRDGDTEKLNRMLLEDAYFMELVRSGGEAFGKAVERNGAFVGGFGKTLVPVETNYFSFGYRYNLSRNMTHGSLLGSVALLLGFERVFIPGSAAYDEITPLGSHPLSDPLWSNEAVEIVHDGAGVRRIEKLARIIGRQAAVDNLRVCASDMNVNCGRCGKCLQTMIPLKLMGVRNAPFPPLPPLSKFGPRGLGDDGIFYLNEAYTYAIATGNGCGIRKEMAALLRRNDMRLAIRHVDAAFFGNFFLTRHMRRTRKEPRFERKNFSYTL